MAPTPGTLVLDDGELADVRAALEEIGIEYTYLRGGAVEGLDVEPPRHLLVATGRRALQLDHASMRAVPGSHGGPVRIVVVSEDSPTLREQLREVGFDYLIRRPVHPAALRLLLLRALYRGPERRVAVRHPIGGPVSYRIGLRRRPATLVEMALRGCRLLADEPVEPDTRLAVLLPKEFTGDKKLSLTGWVVRCDVAGRGPEFEVAVAFETLKSSVERALRELLKSKILGPEVLSEPSPADAPPPPPEPEAEPPPTERRESPRGVYDRRVVAIQNRAQRVLVGRNLSMGGMLVEQNLELRLGDEVRVAIFAGDREEPLVVRARVIREEAGGLALQFADVDEETGAALEGLVAGLPSVERLADGEAEAMGTVVAEIVDEGEVR